MTSKVPKVHVKENALLYVYFCACTLYDFSVVPAGSCEENQHDIVEFCRKGLVLLANEVGKFLLAKDVETSCNSSNK